jgi:hypothetical protein
MLRNFKIILHGVVYCKNVFACVDIVVLLDKGILPNDILAKIFHFYGK